MTVVACFVGGQHYKSIPKYDSLPPLAANLAINAISINSAYTSRVMVGIAKFLLHLKIAEGVQ